MVAAIILAAGSSQRFGRNKLLEKIDGVEVWLKSLKAFQSHPSVDFVGLVCSAEMLERCKECNADFVIEGGETRQQSACIGIAALPESVEIVLIHDAARPWLSGEVISKVIDGVREAGAAFPALPVSDTIKISEDSGLRTLDRSRLYAAQTPQGARRDLFVEAHRRAEAEMTDDMALLEAIGVNPLAVQGDPRNRKITQPHDMDSQMEFRTGLGYDIHKFSDQPDRPMWLGGIEFDDRPGLDGHSDADALLHAVVDALLGGAGLGDIGEHYPNTDPRWKNAPSSLFLSEAAAQVGQNGWKINHVDCSILAERPKILPRRDEMRARIADLIGLDISQVSIKATTNEGLGAIGRGEGIAAFAVATLSRTRP